MAVRTRAPTRLDLAGGTLDLWPLYAFLGGGHTVNVAISLTSNVELMAVPSGVLVESLDTGWSVSGERPADLPADGPLGLVVRIIRHFDPPPGLRIRTRNRAPRGSGLGGSSALAVALAAALARWVRRDLAGATLVDLVANIEAAALGIPTGKQDYWAAVYGGASDLEFGVEGFRRQPLLDTAADRAEFESRAVLCYSGAVHQSAVTNWDMFRGYVEDRPGIRAALAEVAAIAADLAAALRARDWSAVETLVGREWDHRRTLGEGVSTPRMEEILAAARQAGATAGKGCGAGGGGCLLIMGPPDQHQRIVSAVEGAGGQVLSWRVAPSGLTITGDSPLHAR